MGTSYTYELDDNPKLTTAQWVTEHLSRAFGVCITLRDGPFGLSDEEIEEHLEEEVKRSTKYHREKLDTAQNQLDMLEDNPEAWKDLYSITIAGMKTATKRSIKEAKKIEDRHLQARKDLTKLRDDTVDDITRNIAQFGLDQLEIAKSDTEPYIRKIPTFEEFKVSKLKSLNWGIEYYTKNMKETESREGKRVFVYRRIRYEVKRILEGKE